MKVFRAAVFLLLIFISAPALPSPAVWVAPSLVRVGREAAPEQATEIALYAARGETESFQIAIRAQGGPLSGVDVSGGFPGGPAVTLYREHYVYLSTGSPDWATNRNKPGGPGWYPDVLIPFVDPVTRRRVARAAPFAVEANRNQPVWVDVHVPRDARPGTYRGTFTVTSGQGRRTVRATLTVWRFTLPRQPALKSCLLYWPTESGGVGRNQTQPDEELLRHRLMPITVDRGEEARLVRDFGLNATSAGFWSGADQKTGHMKPAPSVTECREAARHEPGVLVYSYTADEIGASAALYAPMKEWARALHAAGLRNLVTMAPTPHLADDGTGRSAVDIWVLLPKMYEASRGEVARALARGDAVWSYNANTQDDYSPKWELDFAPINYRIQPGFLNQSLGFTGLLYWRADNWTRDPWNDPTAMRGYPGEGLLVYPGTPAGLRGVVPSMRLKYLRDGVDDYDYVQLLKDRGEGEWALKVVRRVGRDWSTWTRDPVALEAARRELGERLNADQ